jgi:hypothetical protein
MEIALIYMERLSLFCIFFICGYFSSSLQQDIYLSLVIHCWRILVMVAESEEQDATLDNRKGDNLEAAWIL